jgi:hypothetical protein
MGLVDASESGKNGKESVWVKEAFECKHSGNSGSNMRDVRMRLTRRVHSLGGYI